jgi:hypothetical protein
MSVYTSIKDLPKDINKQYLYENHNGERISVTLSNVSTDSYGSIYTFDYKSARNGKNCYFFISSSNQPSPFPVLTEDKTWQKWTTIE